MTTEHAPSSVADLAALVASCAESGTALRSLGGGTAADAGLLPSTECDTLSLRNLASVVDFPADDLTVTVQAGLRIDELFDSLKAANLELPIDVPDAIEATVGGVVACDCLGPRWFGRGRVRDAVIGLEAVDGSGRVFRAGGRVVKNVAGYDLCKLLTGSLGTLGVLTEVTFKLRPRPAATRSLLFPAADFDDLDLMLEVLLTSETRPVAVEVLGPALVTGETFGSPLPEDAPRLWVYYEGTEADIAWQAQQVTEELGGLAAAPPTILEEVPSSALLRNVVKLSSSATDRVRIRANLRASRICDWLAVAEADGWQAWAEAASGLAHAIRPVDELSAESLTESVTKLRSIATAASGTTVVVDAPAEWKTVDLVQGEPTSAWPLMAAVKRSLDPQNILAPGVVAYSSDSV